MILQNLILKYHIIILKFALSTCRGVNMYAMLVGKLPFRSPRQGTKRRQKLLEQITNGISESHEKEMAHLSPGAKDLIGRLLQPDPRKRTTLEGIMTHLWVTKEGTHPLSPYKQPTVDAGTQAAVSFLSCIHVAWRQSWYNTPPLPPVGTLL